MASSNDISHYIGYCEGLEDGVVTGWAFNRKDAGRPVRLHILVDGQEIAQVNADRSRQDVQAALKISYEKLGFAFRLPAAFHDAKNHELSLRFPDRTIMSFVDPTTGEPKEAFRTFCLSVRTEYTSCVDGLTHGSIRGWVLQRLSTEKEWHGGCIVDVRADNIQIAQTRADRYRGDVAAAVGCNPHCGFEVLIPQRFRGSSPRKFSVTVLPSGEELMGSPFVTSIVDNALETRLLDIAETIDQLHRELTKLRLEIRKAIPDAGYNLNNYNRWAPLYYQTLRERTALLNAQSPLENMPLVSILCPVYKPLKADFCAAVASVFGQSYTAWELLLIDDGCALTEISQLIADFAKQDKRVRVLSLKENMGISGATNAGIAAAKGTYVVFFDHDDVLIDVALDVMVRTALESQAGLLYSDEDKINQKHEWQAPNFKPDFNYRYLLGCNYICHLTMVRADILAQVGLLNHHYDGAQDHDFVLRVCETIPPEQIVHVPELLYHWRMTANSTAVSVGNKKYAITAGVKAVTDHLKRRGFTSSKVSSIEGLSVYRIDWALTDSPRVSIIIPFKDEVETTKRCLERVRERTDYAHYEIILVNNWSVTPQAARFIEACTKMAGVRVLTVEEPFNFSRLNNLAVKQSTADFVFFMNNDVFVEKSDWLRLMMNEALADQRVAAVGAKLLYPNNTVQHAGVVVGPSGIGAHAHRGSDRDDFGYIGRSLLTHEVTAITAAAMLVKRSVFCDVGMFDEAHLKIAYNDVDLCLKMRAAGYRIIYCADAVASHHESLSRGSDDVPQHEARFFDESQVMLQRWGEHPLFRHDPAYSRFLTVDLQPFFDLVDPEKT